MIVLLLALFFSTAEEAVKVIPIHHASLILVWNGRVIHVDPWSQGDYTSQPKADLILITDTHGDHLDPQQVVAVAKPETVVVAPEAVQEVVSYAKILRNGETLEIDGIGIEAVPMYNLERGPEPGRVYHPKGRGNGYVVTLGESRIYISGDTGCIPEMKSLEDIDIAFVCMNLPYTMPPEEAAECVNAFRPRVVYPYHSRSSSLEVFRNAVSAPEVEVRILDWYP